MVSLSAIDIVVVIASLIMVMVVGLYHKIKKRKESQTEETAEGYFLSGRSMEFWAVGFSLFASNIGTEHFVGLAGSGAAEGLAVGYFEWYAAFLLILLGWVFAPIYVQSNIFTTPEFIQKRYSPAIRQYLACVTISLYILTKVSASLFAGSIILEQTIGLNMWIGVVLLVIITGIYTITGGLTAVMYTDVVQAILFIIGGLVVMGVSLSKVGGLGGLKDMLPGDYFHMIKPPTDPNYPWTGIFFGQPIASMWYWCFDQSMVQRILAAKNADTAKGGTLMAGYLKFLPVFMLVFPGMVARALYPEEIEKESNIAFILIVTRLMPQGLIGLMVASMLAALMSSLSSIFNSASTVFTMDIYRRIRPRASEKELVASGKIATSVMVILSILWIPIIQGSGGQLFLFINSIQSYLAPPLSTIFLIGIFWKRANNLGAISALAVGGILGILRLILEQIYRGKEISNGFLEFFVRMNFMHMAIFLFLICTILLVSVSLLTDPPTSEQESMTFGYRNHEHKEEETELDPIDSQDNESLLEQMDQEPQVKIEDESEGLKTPDVFTRVKQFIFMRGKRIIDTLAILLVVGIIILFIVFR